MTSSRRHDRARARPAAVLWDMDGTLVDTEPYWIDCEFELVEAHGGTWNLDHAHAIVGSDLLESAHYIRKHGGVDLPIEEIVNQTARWCDRPRSTQDAVAAGCPRSAGGTSRREDSMRARDDVVATVGRCDRRRTAERLVRRHDRRRRGSPRQTASRAVSRRARGARGLAARCVALEDSPTGVRSATAAGCHVIVIPHIVDVPTGRGHRQVESLTDLQRRQPAGHEAATSSRSVPCCRARRAGSCRGRRRRAPSRSASAASDRHPRRRVGSLLRAARSEGEPGDQRQIAASGVAGLVLGAGGDDDHHQRTT